MGHAQSFVARRGDSCFTSMRSLSCADRGKRRQTSVAAGQPLERAPTLGVKAGHLLCEVAERGVPVARHELFYLRPGSQRRVPVTVE